MANLPADLPENWTQGQIISPNGTEVGLTEQYGYNYLMQQVNAAQTAINNIVAGLTGVAQETSVQEIINNIGNTDDTGGSTTAGSVFAKQNGMISDIATLKSLIQNGVSVIKSIQFGVGTIDSGYETVSITIDRINTDKAFVIINGGITSSDSFICNFLQSKSNTTLTVRNSLNGGGTPAHDFEWQVIEFF